MRDSVALGPSAPTDLWSPIVWFTRTAAGRKAGAEKENFRAVPPARRGSEEIEMHKLVASGGGPTNPSSEMTGLPGPLAQ